VTLTLIRRCELMERSFSGEDPFLRRRGSRRPAADPGQRAGHVEPLDDLIAADAYPLYDFTSQALAAVSDGTHLGLPHCDVSNVLIYRPDLFAR
jgi:ABC-type glycerol-3-phosphate transport system substrate-binding protein